MSMRDIYRKIARENGVTVAEVKRDMQAAVDHAYHKADKTDSEKRAQEVFGFRSVPTAEAFVEKVAQNIVKPKS